MSKRAERKALLKIQAN